MRCLKATAQAHSLREQVCASQLDMKANVCLIRLEFCAETWLHRKPKLQTDLPQRENRESAVFRESHHVSRGRYT
jgi:hypothetical protein